MKMVNRSCPVCGSKDQSKVFAEADCDLTANCHQTWNKNPTPNPLPASDEGARMYLI